jgi:YD repeat-containing protein
MITKSSTQTGSVITFEYDIQGNIIGKIDEI